ncbi:hypothetical protein Nmel_016176 [Mimus melanotis]
MEVFFCFVFFFFFFFFLIPFFILKFEGEKKVCKQVGAKTPGSSKSSQNLCPSACFCSCLQGNYQLFTIIYGHSSTRVFFFLNFIFRMEKWCNTPVIIFLH